MAKQFLWAERDKPFLLPVDMREWLPDDHVVWVLLEVIDRLDVSGLEARYVLGGAGRRAIDPRMLLALLIYSCSGGIRSSRQIERLCRTDVAMRVITGMRVPDHTVIARFRQRHQDSVRELFTQVLLVCAKAGLGSLGTIAIDGTKIAANASRHATRRRQWCSSRSMRSSPRPLLRTLPRTLPAMVRRPGRRRAGNAAFLLEQWQGPADDVADGGPADAAEGVGENVQRAQSSVVEEGEQGTLAVADLLVEDTAAGAGLARAAAPLIGQAFGLGGLPHGEPAGEFMQLVLGEPGQGRMGQPLDDCGSCWAVITVQEIEQGIGGGEPDRGYSRVMAVVFEDLAGFPDEVADAGGGDFQQVGEHVHGADLPLVENSEQQACGVAEQRPGTQVPGGSPGPAAALLAVPGVPLVSKSPLNTRCWPKRQTLQGAHVPEKTLASMASYGTHFHT